MEQRQFDLAVAEAMHYGTMNVPPREWPVDGLFEKFEAHALEAVQTGALAGRLALEAYQRFSRQRVLWHGSPHDLKADRAGFFLKPSQPRWGDSAGRQYNHGPSGVCASDSYTIPLLHALLSRAHVPEGEHLEGSILAYHNDSRDRRWALTTKAYIDIARQAGVRGYVHHIWPAKHNRSYQEPWRDKPGVEAWEYRLQGSVLSDFRVEVTLDDLPPSVMILDAGPDMWRTFIQQLRHRRPIELAEELGIGLTGADGTLPLEIHPYFDSGSV